MNPVPNRSNKFRGTANPELHRAMVELRRSSAPTPVETNPERKRSRKANKSNAIQRSLKGE